MSLNQLTKPTLEQAINYLCLQDANSLNVLSSFFIQGSLNSCLNKEDNFHSLGQPLKTLSTELSHVEDTLTCKCQTTTTTQSKNHSK